ncbi:MAG: hypothetical protein KKA64_01470 [Nanoarchaeota archaeon]|nr:hypothetical protein [Nanoarchaeota archaeon]
MIKRMNRRGQAGGEWGTIIAVVIAAILLVLVILVMTGFFGPIGDLFGSFPKLGVAVSTCNLFAQGGQIDDYCNVPKKVEIDGLKQYATCKYLETKATLETKIDDCTGIVDKQDFAAFCDNMKLSEKILVDGKSCEDTPYNTEAAAKASCKKAGDIVKYKAGTETKSHTCAEGEGSISPA